MSLYNDTKYIMKKYNIYANKKLGQNFLIDENIVNKIIEKSQISKNDLVIEIGPGLGTLTQYLLENAKKVVCIELDERMIKILSERFILYNNLKIVHGDILNMNIEEILDGCTNAKVVANLPYYITTPIIMKLFENHSIIDTITVMVQKEVADRICAQTGDTFAGAITYAIRYYAIPEILLDVPKNSFIPEPNVESSVIRLKMLKEPSVSVADEELLFRIIKTAFMQRRKTLVNALNTVLSKEKIKNILKELEIDDKIRGEKLNLNQFAQIADLVKKEANIL